MLLPEVELVQSGTNKSFFSRINFTKTGDVEFFADEMPLGDFDVFLQSLKFGKSSIISGPMKSFDIMVYPVINEVQKDKDNNLYLSGSGFENDCEFLVSNWPCIRDFTYELDSLSKMRCHVQQPRGLFDIPHFPSDLGMQIQLFDLQEFTQFPTWANILSFATEDRLVLEQQLSTMIFSWEQNVALVRSHGYFNPSFQKGSFRIDTIGLVLVRVSQCDPESGFCASPTTILTDILLAKFTPMFTNSRKRAIITWKSLFYDDQSTDTQVNYLFR